MQDSKYYLLVDDFLHRHFDRNVLLNNLLHNNLYWYFLVDDLFNRYFCECDSDSEKRRDGETVQGRKRARDTIRVRGREGGRLRDRPREFKRGKERALPIG